MSSPDSDYRFMSLNDLLSILTSPNASLTQADSNLTSRVIDGVVKALDDANGEVQNLAVKWYVNHRSYPPSSNNTLKVDLAPVLGDNSPCTQNSASQ